jgi:hypothetical protein
MRCREVKRRLNNGRELTAEMEEHLRECAGCAAAARAAGDLARAFRMAKTADNLPATPLATVREKVARPEQEQYQKESRFMSTLREQFSRRPRFSTGLVVAVVVILFVTLVPFSYDRTVGYEVAFNGVTASGDYTQTLPAALKVLGYESASVNVTQEAGKVNYTIGNLPSRVAAKEAAAVFAVLTGSKAQPQINAVTETVSGSLYAQVRDGIIRIEIDSAGKSDSEIASEIEARLADYGFNDTQVQVNTSPDGQRQMSIFIGDADAESGKETEQTIELKMNSGDDQNVSFEVGAGLDDSEMQQIIEDNKDMSDSELESLLESKFAEKGIPDANVTVTTRADGKREVQVDLNQQKWNMDN